MSSLAYAVSDTVVIAKRNLLRIPRQPDLLIAYTIQPIMFTLLFVYVFGGAISTPGFDYVDFLMPGIIVQSIAFGGFVTALGLSEDVSKGLIDRFRSLPMSRAAVLLGRTTSDIPLNCLSLVVLFAGVPSHSERTASAHVVNGFASANWRRPSGIDAAGTNTEEANVSGNSTVNPIELAVSGVDENSPTSANTHENA